MELNDVIVNQPVVIDNGSGVIKAGFAGDQIPKCRFPNYCNRNMPGKRQKVKQGVKKYGIKSNYTTETLEAALREIRSGTMSRLAASKFYKIPPVTLFYKLKSKHDKKFGRPLTFTKEEETSFKAYLLQLTDLGIPLNMTELRYAVKNYLDSNSITKSQFKNNLPGYDWGVLFLQRNPKLQAKITPKICRKGSKITQEKVENFFKDIKTKLEGVSPENTYSMDELGFHDNMGKNELLFRRDFRHPDGIKSTSTSSHTVVFCANATGKVLPPFFIFKGKTLWSGWVHQVPSGSRMAVSESGWINSSVFEEWLERHFIPNVNKQNGKKVVLCNNLSAHISPKTLRLCSEHNISFICLIPNSTHLLQPLDVCYFSGLETAWRKVLTDHRQLSKGKKVQAIPKPLFAQLLKKSMDSIEGTSADNLEAGFRSCGFHPISPDTVLNKLPKYRQGKSQARFSDAVGTSFIKRVEEIRQRDLNVSVKVEEVECYEERDKTNKRKRKRELESETQTYIDNESCEMKRQVVKARRLVHRAPPLLKIAKTSPNEVIKFFETNILAEDKSLGKKINNEESPEFDFDLDNDAYLIIVDAIDENTEDGTNGELQVKTENCSR